MSMRLTKFSLAAAACVAAALSTATPASAEEEPPPGTATVTQARPVVLATASGDASVLFHYTCSSPDQSGHLYVAVKQGPSISPENTSSQGATAYSSTNWNVDQGANQLVCDGRKHVLQAELEPDPNFQGTGTLTGGSALVQICVIDATGLTMDYTMKPVVITGSGV
jgi:hypothetical protein